MLAKNYASEPLTRVEFKLTDGVVGAQVRCISGAPWACLERAATGGPTHYKVAVGLRVAEFCLVLPYLQSGHTVSRTPVADWPAFAHACAALGVPELSMLIVDDAELVFLSALTPRHLWRREAETRVRQLYQLAETVSLPASAVSLPASAVSVPASAVSVPAASASATSVPAEAAGSDDPPAEAASVPAEAAGCDDPPAEAVSLPAEAAGCDDPPAEAAKAAGTPASAAGCDDPPAEAAEAAEAAELCRRFTELAKYSTSLRELDAGKLAREIAALKIGDLVCELPPKILLMSDVEIAREYPYVMHAAKPPPGYISVACATQSLQGNLAGFPWRVGASAQFVLAGGAVLKHLRARQGAFAASDYDFFLVGADKATARAAVAEFHAWVAARTGGRFMAWRTEHAISFVAATEVLQIVLRLNPSVERVLLNFDIDVCCVAFDGEKFWSTPRGIAALRSGVHLGDPARQSTTFDRRAPKYERRGYQFAFPGLSATAYARLTRNSGYVPRVIQMGMCADPARSMIERVLRGGRKALSLVAAEAAAAAAANEAADERSGDYAPHYSVLGEEARAPFTSYIRNHLWPIYRNEMRHVHVATTALAPLLDTPQGAPLAEIRAAVDRGDPLFVYTAPLAPANSITFLEALGHGQLTGSINPVTINSWYPNE
jgi:hypothetical protein